MNKFTFLGQLPEEDKDDLVLLAASNTAIYLTEANGEARLTVIPNSTPETATEAAEAFETDWTTANP